MKKGEWLILEQDRPVPCVWHEVDAEISSTAQGEAWIKREGIEGAVYAIATCRAKVRCAKRPVDKFVTVCEDVE